MPLYYFHIANGTTVLDADGTEFADVQAVKLEAIQTSGEMLRNVAITSAARLTSPWKLWVTDQPEGNGQTVFKMKISVE